MGALIWHHEHKCKGHGQPRSPSTNASIGQSQGEATAATTSLSSALSSSSSSSSSTTVTAAASLSSSSSSSSSSYTVTATAAASPAFKCFCGDILNSCHAYLQHYNMKHPEATKRNASSRVAELHLLGLGPELEVPTKQALRGMEWKAKRTNGSGQGQGKGKGDGSRSQMTAFKSLLMCSGEWLVFSCNPVIYHRAQSNNPVKSDRTRQI